MNPDETMRSGDGDEVTGGEHRAGKVVTRE